MSKYFDSDILLGRLLKNYYKYGSIVVAFDFDDTVRDYYSEESIQDVVDLLRLLKVRGYAKLMCFTCRSGDGDFTAHGETWVKNWLKEHDIEIDSYNAPLVDVVDSSGKVAPQTGKPYYNIFLDDKCGLGQAFDILERFVKILDADLK